MLNGALYAALTNAEPSPSHHPSLISIMATKQDAKDKSPRQLKGERRHEEFVPNCSALWQTTAGATCTVDGCERPTKEQIDEYKEWMTSGAEDGGEDMFPSPSVVKHPFIGKFDLYKAQDMAEDGFIQMCTDLGYGVSPFINGAESPFKGAVNEECPMSEALVKSVSTVSFDAKNIGEYVAGCESAVDNEDNGHPFLALLSLTAGQLKKLKKQDVETLAHGTSIIQRFLSVYSALGPFEKDSEWSDFPSDLLTKRINTYRNDEESTRRALTAHKLLDPQYSSQFFVMATRIGGGALLNHGKFAARRIFEGLGVYLKLNIVRVTTHINDKLKTVMKVENGTEGSG